MGDVALLTVVGRLTKDAVAEAIPNTTGRFAIKFTVASSYYQKGAQDRPVNYYECRLYMGQDRWNTAQQFLKKGRLVCVWGELRPRMGADSQGGQRLWLNVEDVGFEPIGPKPEESTQPTPQTQAAPQTQPQAAGHLPQGWRQEIDPASQRPYYVGPSNQTQWERPAPPPVPQAAPPATPPPAGPPMGGGQYGGGPPGYPDSPI